MAVGMSTGLLCPSGAPLRLVIVTNMPAPYRVPVFDRVAATPGMELHVLYATRAEADRRWDPPPLRHGHTVLPGWALPLGGRFIHLNPGIGAALRRLQPQVVLTTGYNPTHLLAWRLARRHGLPHVAMTDGTLASEARLGPLHRALRRHVLARTASAVVASDGGARLMAQYGVPADRVHRSVLCAHAGLEWQAPGPAGRDIDLLFAGRLVAVKSPGFAVEVAAGVARRLGRRVRLAMLGSGPLADAVRQLAARHEDVVDTVLAGHVAQGDLPGWYGRARVFLFPTRWDPWGVVANEACESGVPVLVSPHAGVAGELVRDFEGGRVLPLDLPAWVEAAASLLSDDALHHHMAAAARRAVQPFHADAAAAGIVRAARQAAGRAA
ncbi:MAG: hypothetical protein RJA10_1187 [Pseudomonadota bacterium]|jgi:glycosyltransferase involved in cell wall biosynthesis